MPEPVPRSLTLPDAEATDRLGRRLAPRLRAGDTLLLEGPLGAGKTALARAIVQARLEAAGRAEEVPSPSFTLIQTYEADIEIWHCDLYRLSDPQELLELGLDEAFPSALCLIEWPDRLGPLTPPRHLRVTLAETGGPAGEGRVATLTPAGPEWERVLEAA